ncbi:MAG: alpha/beta fold hydrolase [Pseudomonadota bacterium]
MTIHRAAALIATILGLLLFQPLGVSEALAQNAQSSEAKPPIIPARYFAARPIITNATLSPDGRKIAFLKDDSGVAQFIIADPVSGATLATQFMPEGFDVIGYSWIDSARILVAGIGIVRKDRYRYRVRKLFVAMPEANYVRALIDDPFLSSSAQVVRMDEEGDWALVAHKHRQNAKFPSVYRYDLRAGGSGVMVQPMIEGVTYWSADEAGVVRLGQGFRKGRVHVWYRSDDRLAFDKQSVAKPGREEGFLTGVQLRAGSDTGYAITEGASGRVGLQKYDFANLVSLQTVYENPGWDVDGVWYDEGEPKAAFFTDDASQIVWFDKGDLALHNELKSALGGEASHLVYRSVSDDDQRRLIVAGNASDPGILYFFDRASLTMKELAELRPALDFTQLSMPQPIRYTARDGSLIQGYLTLPRGREPRNLPLIVMPHGGPFGVRDALRYHDWVQLLANRGYAVLQPNFRGSGGYGDAFYDLGRGQVGRGMQDDLDDAMDWAVAQGLADPARVCLVGGSYGGYAAIWGVLRNPERYRCAASWAGVTDWDRMLRFDRKYLTRDAKRRWQAKIEGEGADLAQVSPMRLAQRLSKPVLLAHGTRDNNVPFSQFEQMAKAAEDAPVTPTQLIVHGAGHSFTTERHHLQWLDALDLFLAEHNPADQVDETGAFRKPEDPELDAMFTPLFAEERSAKP